MPEQIPGCPPGLEYLTQIDQLLVNQQVELFEGNAVDNLPSSPFLLLCAYNVRHVPYFAVHSGGFK